MSSEGKVRRPAPENDSRVRNSASPTRQTGGAGTPQSVLLALQSGAGNAAVVQMLRRSGHPGAQDAAQEQHRHDAGCGHGPPVQRSVVHDVLRSGGRPLDETTRADMESRFDTDFSDVRIHDDGAARASAAEIGARAYTSGSHVVIGEGGGDKHTLAHELTHVVQQRRGPVAGTDDGSGLKVSDPSDRFERAAEANARRVMSAPAPGRRAEADAAPHGAGARPGDASVQRAPATSPEKSPTGSTGSEVSSGPGTAERRSAFSADRAELKQRISRIGRLAEDSGFTGAIDELLATVERDLAADGPTPVNSAVIGRVMEGLQQKGVYGNRIQYDWYVRNQGKEGFDQALEHCATQSANHAHLWSKLGAAVSVDNASVGRGVVLESSIQGRIFDGLLFGLPGWTSSPTFSALWERLSSSYVETLTGHVTASVLDGTTDSSVLNRIEWPLLRERIRTGQADGLEIVVYRAEPDAKSGRHELVQVGSFLVRNQEEFDRVPKAPGDGAWHEKQSQVNKQQGEELSEVRSRQSRIAEFDAYVSELFRAHGEDLTFRESRTPPNTRRNSQAD